MDDYLDQFTEDHLNGGYGDILDQLNSLEGEEYPDLDYEEPWDSEQQELELFEGSDECYGYFGGDEEW